MHHVGIFRTRHAGLKDHLNSKPQWISISDCQARDQFDGDGPAGDRPIFAVERRKVNLWIKYTNAVMLMVH